MSTLLFSIMTVSLALGMVTFDVQAEQDSAENGVELSPISPPLIREGDFAIKMAEVLGLGAIEDEDDAGLLLAEIDLAPRNGWVPDYPVTPMVLAELREAVIASAASGKLTSIVTEALKAFDRLALELGLSVDETAQLENVDQPPEDGSSAEEDPYGNPPGTQGDYATQGPPVMTYDPPPSHYYGYYDWVPYPFYFSRSYFSGFFILHDFRRVHKFHRHFGHKHHHKQYGFHNRFKRKFISNHRWNHGLGKTELFQPHKSERAERFGGIGSGRDGRDAFRNSGVTSRRFEAPSTNYRGPNTTSFRGDGRHSFPGSFRGPGRIENRAADRRFSSERRKFGHPNLRRGEELPGRSSPHFRRRGANPGRPAESYRQEGEGAFRSFRSNSHNGTSGGSLRSFHHQSRGFSGSGGGGARGRR